MQIRLRRLLVPAFATLLVAVAAASAVARSSLVGEAAPDLNARDWLRSDGRVEIADFRGEMALLVFWKTECPASRSALPQLARLDEDLRKRGLNIIGVTHEDRATAQRYLVHRAPRVGFPTALGAGGGYEVETLPHAVLIDPEGEIVWEGRPGGLGKKDLERRLRYVSGPDVAARDAIAARMLERARGLVADGRLHAADTVLERIATWHDGSDAAETAEKRSKLLRGDEHAAEWKAQADVVRIVGGPAGPPPSKKRLKSRDLAQRAKRLDALATKVEEDAPHAARIAREWAALFREPWTD